MIYPTNPVENVKFRAKLLINAEKDDEVKAAILKQCENDPLFFINTFGYTYNPRVEPYDFEFITYPFQDRYITELVDCIENGRDSITEKSRDMGVSWMYVALQVWGFLFKGWSSLYGSYKENYVDEQGNLDSNFERIRYFMGYLPKWMKPNDLIMKYMGISSKNLKAEIAGDSGQNFGTGGRRKVVFLDEFALWQFAEKAFRKTRDVAFSRVFNGTPEGKFNVYGKIMTNHKDYSHIEIKKFRLHWNDHPLKDLQWYNKECANRTSEDVARELDISYDASVKGAVYPDFAKVATFGEYVYDPRLPLYTSWDFGRDMTAIIWVQHDAENERFIIIDAYQLSAYEREGVDIKFYAAFVTGIPTPGYHYTKEELELIKKHEPWKNKYYAHFGDPYNANSKTINAKSSIADKLREFNINIITKKDSRLEERISKAKLLMRQLYINKHLSDFIEAIEQSRYPKVTEGSQASTERTKPIHDATSHYRTAYEYFGDNKPKIVIEVSREELVRQQRAWQPAAMSGISMRRSHR